MTFGLYAIFDRVSGEFGQISMHAKKELAERSFDYVMQSAPMVAGDCDLYCVGYYDTETGNIVPADKPAFIRRFEKGVQIN